MANPPVPTSLGPNGEFGVGVNTATPTITATLGPDSDGNWVRAQWQLAKDSAFTTNLITVTESLIDARPSGQARQLLPSATPLDNGTWYMRARSIDTTNAASAYSATVNFMVILPGIETPTEIIPSNNAVVSSSTPLLSGLVVAASDQRKTGIQWQFARDAAFTVESKTFTSTLDENVISGIVTHKAESVVPQGNWYVRARAYYGVQTSPWTETSIFVVFHQPMAIPQGEQSGATIPSGTTITLPWIFNDPSETDTQSAYQLQIERNEQVTLVLDTSKVGGAATSYVVPISLPKDELLRWHVRVWDADDVAGPWSAYTMFRVSDRPVVAITSPTAGSTIATGAPIVRWTVTASNGRVQKYYSVVIKNSSTGETLVDSGLVESGEMSYTVSWLPTGITWNLTVTVIDSSGLSSI
jgi:hypothetical protein